MKEGSKSKSRARLPHYRVYTRLAPSRRHGVGVFAIKAIKKGQYLFYGDDADLMWIRKSKIKSLPKPLKKLYDDFCILKGDRYGCPQNFNQLTVAWYLNDSKRPNVGVDKNYRFYALRDIRAGEELTVDYSTYSEEP